MNAAEDIHKYVTFECAKSIFALLFEIKSSTLSPYVTALHAGALILFLSCQEKEFGVL
jgi:hypothetical protein